MLTTLLPPTELTGGIAALTAALLWAIASLLFSRLAKDLSTLEINLLKGVLALLFLLAALFLSGGTLAALPAQATWLLFLSGAIGITFGDSAFLQALKYLGPRRALLLATLAPPMTGLIAWAFLGESLSWISWVGIVVTISGVAWVITERSHNSAPMQHVWRGVLFAFMAALAQSTAVVFSRFALTRTPVGSLQSAILRLFAAVILLAVWQLVTRQPLVRLEKFRQKPSLTGWVLLATFFGSFLALWLQQISVEFAPAGIAQTLMSTSPLFILPIAALMGEKLSFRAVVGALVALAGVWLLMAA